jgi:ubiquinone/menaquinone biosynthesis C-methylase UbiE
VSSTVPRSSDAPEPSRDEEWPERFVPGAMSGLIEAEHTARYVWAAQAAAGCHVLDAGCGIGYGAAIMLSAGAATVSGIDISEQAIAEALSSQVDGATFVVGDIQQMPFEDSSFELVVCFEAIEHVADQNVALDEIRRVLRTDGVLLISSPNRLVYEQGNPHHTFEYTPDELEQALHSRFAHVGLYRQQSWMASLIGNDDEHRADDELQELSVSTRKLASGEPGRETFTLASASDVEHPALRGLAMMTDTSELIAWQGRARSAEQHYAVVSRDARRAAALVEQARAERDHAQRSAADRARQTERERDDALRQVDEQRRRLEAADQTLRDVLGSPSWRLTAPLRAAKRTLRAARR